ncbi:MAG: hypothetical protein AAB410_00640 [Patescibacteria group bacterium]
MTTLTIPKELSKEKDLVVIPKRVYLKLLSGQKKAGKLEVELSKPARKIPYFKPTSEELREFRQAQKDYAAEKYMSLEELNNALDLKRSK